MNDDLVARLQALMERHAISGLHIVEGNLDIRIGRDPVAPIASAGPAPQEDRLAIRATAIGHVLYSHPWSAEKPDFPRRVAAGECVAWLKAGALLRPVTALADGLLGDPVVAQGTLVGYGERLF